MITETELIKKAAEGDAGAFRQLFENHQTAVFNMCFRISGNRVDAEDLAQETFVRAYRSLHLFRHESSFGTWIYRIAVNLSFNHIRKNKKFRVDLFHEYGSDRNHGKVPDLPDTSHPEQALEQKEREKIIAWAIGALPEKQRMAIALQKYEGLSVQKIAESMGWSAAAVQSLLQRAKKNLYKILLPYVEDL